MKIAAIQTRPVKGDIAGNLQQHQLFINRAVEEGAELIVFPELSLTGYEPSLAAALAINPSDKRMEALAETSLTKRVSIGVGIPTKNKNGTCISMLFFQPGQPIQVYSKKYLHADEEPFFTSGENLPLITVNDTAVAPAICYEISIPAHAAMACQNGAGLYMASVAKSASGTEKAFDQLSAIAHRYSIPVMMANCVGACDDFDSNGQTAAWTSQGELAAALNNKEEGMLIFDMKTNRASVHPFNL